MHPVRLLGAALAATLVAAGCSSDPDAGPTDVPTVVASLPGDPSPSPSPSSTPAPLATPTPTPSATPLVPPPSVEGPVSDTPVVLTRELAGVEYPKSGGSCPVGEVGSTIVDCAAIEAAGGTVAVIVEEQPDTRHIAIMLRLDEDVDLWFPVKFSAHYGFVVPDSPWVNIVLNPVQNLFAGDVILVEGIVGGTGGVTGWDVVTWPAGEDQPRVIAAFAPVGGVSLRVAGGAVYQTTANYSDGAANCCPNLQDRRIINLATGFGRVWEAMPNDHVSPMVAAFELYQRWLNDDQAGAAAWATTDAIEALWPSPQFDVHQFADNECVPMPEAFQCSLQNEAGIRHFLVAPGGINGYEVVDIVNLAD